MRVLIAIWCCAAVGAGLVPAASLPAEEIKYYGVQEAQATNDVTDLAESLPFAYYPSLNKLEVAIKVPFTNNAGVKQSIDLPAGGIPVRVLVTPVAGGKPVGGGVVHLSAAGEAQALIDLPELAEGEYAVDYDFGGGVQVRAAHTIKRVRFPWENNQLGLNHKVYPPFTPVKVSDRKVGVVGRTYSLNALGLFDSVVSQNRELLAKPMTLVCETSAGVEKWTPRAVRGEVKHDDLAVFACQADSPALSVSSVVEIEEDGCAKVAMTLKPGAVPAEIRRMWIEIPLKDEEARLFHFAAENSMRHNYGSATPRGHNITWDLRQKGWWPITWKAEPGPEDTQLWNSSQFQIMGGENVAISRPFVPYIWLGGEERGLAWFGETDRYYVTDRKLPVQVLSREDGIVYLRVYLVQKPVTFDGSRTIVFGLQASPAKPLDKGWRTRTVATGVGPVVCWGGYCCADKYPDARNFEIVDKLQEIRRTKKMDRDWFVEYDKRRTSRRKVAGDDGWLRQVLYFAERAAPGLDGPGIYFEEHNNVKENDEWQVFQDEWDIKDFSRFRGATFGLSVAQRSYQDFALYYANEWMKRGVSLYFDNTNLKMSTNQRFSESYRLPPGARPKWVNQIQMASEIFGARQYYKRMWKLAREWNENGAPYPIDLTYHMTNTDELPIATWATGVLELEQELGNVPWPPEYVRAVIMNRQAGCISFVLDYLTGQARNLLPADNPPEMVLTSWGMGKVHDVRGGYMDFDPKYQKLGGIYNKALLDFGYGQDTVAHHNYWEEKPFAQVADDQVKWLALTRESADPFGLILLQSYRKEEAKTRVKVPGGTRYREIHTGETLTADGQGIVEVTLPANYGTRMYEITTK